MALNAALAPNIVATQPTGQPDVVKGAREQIDRITYLASLASRFEDVDPMLDSLRGITAAWDGVSPLPTTAESRLDDLEARLKRYLIASDPVRTFTAESLDAQLKLRAQRGGALKRNYLSLIGVLGLSIFAAGLPFMLPSAIVSGEARMLLAIPLFFVVLHVGISWLYLSALKNFQQEVRKAFQLICVGVMLFGVAFSQYVAISAFQLDRYKLFQDAGFTWIVAAPFIFFFFGLRMYAKQVQVKSRLLSLWFVLAVAGAGATLATVEAIRFSATGSVTYLDVLQVAGGRMIDIFSAISAILAWKIRKVVAPAYARPMTWMFVYLFFSFIASMISSIMFITGSFEGESGSSSSVPFYVFMAMAGVPVQLLLMWTGYVFKREVSK